MFEADLVISDSGLRRINAYEVEHIDYPRIFQCPACKAPLDLVKGHLRGNQFIDPTFRHRSEDREECNLRVSFDMSPLQQDTLDLLRIKQGQNRKRLEKVFLNLFKEFLIEQGGKPFCNARVVDYILKKSDYPNNLKRPLHLERQVKHNLEPGQSHSDPKLLIKAAVTVISANQSDQYVERDCAHKILQDLRDDPQVSDYFSNTQKKVLRYGRNELGEVVYWSGQREDISKDLELRLQAQCKTVIGILSYVRHGTSDIFRTKFLELALLGGAELPLLRKYFYTDEELKSDQRWFAGNLGFTRDVGCNIQGRRERDREVLREFSAEMLSEICEENSPRLRYAFAQLYSGVKSPESVFIQFILSKSVRAIQYFDWSILPYHY